jgi:hypothetical protein
VEFHYRGAEAFGDPHSGQLGETAHGGDAQPTKGVRELLRHQLINGESGTKRVGLSRRDDAVSPRGGFGAKDSLRDANVGRG